MSKQNSSLTRRAFLINSAAVAAGTALTSEITAAPAIQSSSSSGDKIRVGFIGVGNRGSQLLQGFLDQKDCQVIALCDVYEPYLARDRSRVDPEIVKSIGDGLVPRMGERFEGEVSRHKDFRRLLEQKDIDAVVIATPDHWHALQTIAALEAGKDVYVEKPLTATIPEGRKMVQAQQRTGRVVQVGLHRRSSRLYDHLHSLIQQGKIGKVSAARAYRVSNMSPKGIGQFPDAEPPQGLDWNMWLGPRAWRAFRYNIAPYKFRWWQDYSSQMGNWGVHYCDAIRWMLDEEAPAAVSAHGGKFALDDDRTIPDTLEVTFEFASGRALHFAQYEASDLAPLPGEIELCGTLGSLYPGADLVEFINLPGPDACREILRATIASLSCVFPDVAEIVSEKEFERAVELCRGLDGRRIRKAVLSACTFDKRTALDPNRLTAADVLRSVEHARRELETREERPCR